MSLRDEPHYQVASSDLADWLERQGTDIWWSVDGDPILTGRIILPAPADELADLLRRMNRPLLIRDPDKSPTAHGQEVSAQELDKLVSHFGDYVQTPDPGPKAAWMDDRVFYLAWPDRGDEWLLYEDTDSTEVYRKEAAIAQDGK